MTLIVIIITSRKKISVIHILLLHTDLTHTLFVSDVNCWDDIDCRQYDAVCNFMSKYSPNFGYECSCPDSRPYDKALKKCQRGRSYAVVAYSSKLNLR